MSHEIFSMHHYLRIIDAKQFNSESLTIILLEKYRVFEKEFYNVIPNGIPISNIAL
jgi:hypothetical protein